MIRQILLKRVAALTLTSLMLLLALNTETFSVPPPPPVPNPVLAFDGTENYQAGGQNWTRYKLSVTNRAAYPAEMFAPAPQLPPCGANSNSARTWVDIFDRAGHRLYGFCALGSPADLGSLWFAVKQGTKPPAHVYIVMNDRRAQRHYKSNLVATSAP